MIFVTLWFTLVSLVSGLSLQVDPTKGNKSSPLLYGIFYEDISHSGDGGMYGELIRNRAFQGSSANGVASTARNTDYWHAYGAASISIDQSAPTLSSALPYQMRVDIPVGTTGTVGVYNEGFWGFNVDSTKSYNASLYMRGTYSGNVQTYFKSNTTGTKLSSANMTINQNSTDGWKQIYTPTFNPIATASNANNTFYFEFDGAALAGQSIYLNLFSVFKQTFNDRGNGLREDLAEAVLNLGAKYLRMPGGNNMEGNQSPYYWKWNETIGDLTARPGRPGTWGDVNTDGLGLLELLQWSLDMNQTIVLGVWAGLYLDGEIVTQSDIQPYVDQAVQELEFLLGDASTAYGAKRAALGYPNPFTNIKYIEIGNEDYLNNGTNTYYSYRFNAFANAIASNYSQLQLISTTNPSPQTTAGANSVDIHLYGNEAYFVSLFNTFDQVSRQFPVFVAEYAATNTGSNSTGQVGAQTMGMACAEAIFLLGCERNSDVINGTSYGALIKDYNEAPDTVAVIKQTANEILYTISYYVQQLFAEYKGENTYQVAASGGGYGPVYWSATGTARGSTILKLVNYNGATGSNNSVIVSIQGSTKNSAKVVTLTAPSQSSVNNLPGLGGESSTITTSTISASGGNFSISFSNAFEIAILVV